METLTEHPLRDPVFLVLFPGDTFNTEKKEKKLAPNALERCNYRNVNEMGLSTNGGGVFLDLYFRLCHITVPPDTCSGVVSHFSDKRGGTSGTLFLEHVTYRANRLRDIRAMSCDFDSCQSKHRSRSSFRLSRF
ncbi:hypothetical protein AVEN_128549-1 [Araneus ventricosus]|uniref:Uncharacterized protein n=1 Tax=Araneus ventricosus TaxID=182803 RepID=A0A4Y2JXP4_ARAVE|nr:hypothetical protein AVEN_128549-1 [Araneus ventricosus]